MKRKRKDKKGGEDLHILGRVHKRIHNLELPYVQPRHQQGRHPLSDRYNFHLRHNDGVHPDTYDLRNSDGTLRHPRSDLHRLRPPPGIHLGQQLSLDTRMKSEGVNPHPYGFERFINLYDSNISYRFEHFQNDEPVDWLKNMENSFNIHDESIHRPPIVEDVTLANLEKKVWLGSYRKGQKYWDYCRDVWVEKQNRVGAAMGPVASIYSLWRGTELCLNYGGWAFLSMYLIVMGVFVLPLIYTELAIGQFFRSGPIKSFERGCRLFRGVGILMLVACGVETAFSLTRMSWMLFYLGASTTRSTLPWGKCEGEWNSVRCEENPSPGGDGRTPAMEFWRGRVLRYWKSGWANDVGVWEPFYIHLERKESGEVKGYDNPRKSENGLKSYGVTEPGFWPNLDLTICLLLIIFVLKKIMRSKCVDIGKLFRMGFFFASTLTSLCLLPRVYTVANSAYFPAWEWFLKGEHFTHFSNPKAWSAAILHAITSSGVGTGLYISLGSHNTFINDEIKSAALLSGCASFAVHVTTSIFFVICTFAVRASPGYDTNPEGFGSDIFFDIFPHVVALHPRPGFGWFIFAGMFGGIVLLGLMRIICLLNTIKQCYCDANKELYDPIRVHFDPTRLELAWRQWRYKNWYLSGSRKEQLMLYFLGGFGIFNILTFFPGGFLYFHLLESFWYKFIPVFIVLMETLAIYFFLGIRLLNQYVRVMTTWQVTLGFRFLWKIFTFIPLLYFLLLTPGMEGLGFDGVEFPWPLLVGGYAMVGVIYGVFLVITFKTWGNSKAEGCWSKLVLETSPEHDHEDMIWSRKPSSRLHWMHHQLVPSGVRKGYCRKLSGITPKWDRPKLEWTLLELLFLAFGLRKLGKLSKKMEVEWAELEENYEQRDLFVRKPFPIKVGKPDVKTEHIPNEQIQRIRQYRKKAFVRRRHLWLKEILEFHPQKEPEKKEEDEETKKKGGERKKKKDEEESSSGSSGSSSSGSGSWSDDAVDEVVAPAAETPAAAPRLTPVEVHQQQQQVGRRKWGVGFGTPAPKEGEETKNRSLKSNDKTALWKKALSARRNDESWDEFVKHAQEGDAEDD